MPLRSKLLLSFLAALALPAAASAASFAPMNPSAYRVTKAGFSAKTYGRIAQLERTYPRRSLVQIAVSDANRATQPLDGISSVAPVANVENGFRWSNEDEFNTSGADWWPQGITGSADAAQRGSVGGHKILIATWYKRRYPNRTTSENSRISIVLADRLAGARYRNVLLVRPEDGGTFKLTPNHGGGVAWYGPYVYVADSSFGFRVYDTRHILFVPKARRKAIQGYKYILPQAGSFHVNHHQVLSFVSLDRSTSPDSFVSGHYDKHNAGAPLVRWRLDGHTHLMVPGAAEQGWRLPEPRTQGALARDGILVSSSSNGEHPGTLAYGRSGRVVRTKRWAISPEDLFYSASTDRLYTLTERPGIRAVFGIDARTLGF